MYSDVFSEYIGIHNRILTACTTIHLGYMYSSRTLRIHHVYYFNTLVIQCEYMYSRRFRRIEGHGEEDAATADEGASARPSRARKAPKRAGDDQGASAAKGLAKKSKKK